MSQHYEFAHRLLVDFALGRPRERVEQFLLSPMLDGFLEDFWDEAAETDPLAGAPEDDDAFIEGLMRGEFDRSDDVLPTGRTLSLDDDTPAVLVNMPPPESTTEPYYCLIVLGEGVRFFTLERSNDDSGDESQPMLCEWVLEGGRKHVNYGTSTATNPDEFLQTVADLLSPQGPRAL